MNHQKQCQPSLSKQKSGSVTTKTTFPDLLLNESLKIRFSRTFFLKIHKSYICELSDCDWGMGFVTEIVHWGWEMRKGKSDVKYKLNTSRLLITELDIVVP